MSGLSKAEFLHFLLEKLSLKDDEKSNWIVDEPNFAIKHGSNTFSMTGNYDKYSGLSDTEEREKHLQSVAGILRSVSSSAPKSLDSKFEDIRDHIFPRIRETEYVQEVNSEHKAPEKIVRLEHFQEKPSALAPDINNNLTPEAQQKHATAWGQSAEQLFEVAVANLRKRTPSPFTWTKVDGGFEPAIEDDHVAARCLLPDIFASNIPKDTMGGDEIIIIPADDRLVATFSMDQLGLCFLGDTLLDYEEDADADNTITQQPLRLQTTPVARWAPFEPRENEGRIPTDEKDVEMLFNAIKLASQKFAADQLGAGPGSSSSNSGGALDKCAACSAQNVTLSKCSRCMKVVYCSRDCQKSDWPNHKKNCAQK